MSLLDSMGRSVDSHSHSHRDDDSTLDADTPHTDPRRPSLQPSGLTTPGEGASRGSSVTPSPRAWLRLGGGGGGGGGSGEEGSDASIDPSLDPSRLMVTSPACLLGTQ